MAKKRSSHVKVPMTDVPHQEPCATPAKKDLIEAYFKNKEKLKPITDSTKREYRRYLGAYISALGGMDRVDGDNDRMRAVLIEWLSEPMEGGMHGKKLSLTSGTINRRRAYVSAWLRWLNDEGIIPGLNAGKILHNIIKRTEKKQKLPVTQDEIDAIGDYLLAKYKKTTLMLDLRNYLIYQTLITTGMRATECGSFTRKDLKITALAGATVRLDASITKTQTERYVPIADIDPAFWLHRSSRGKTELHKLWELYYQAHVSRWDDSTPLFCTVDGKPCTSSVIYQQIKPVMQKFGINAKIHTLRHWALTQLAAVSKDVVLVQEIAGHASITTTMLYMHPDSNKICADAAENIRKIRNRAS